MIDYKGNLENIASGIRELSADTVFGEARQFGDKMIIPVAKVSYGWGGGGGKAPGQEGEGSGSGGGAKLSPIGYVTIAEDKVTYQPIVDLGKILTLLVPVIGWVAYRTVKACAKSRRSGR